MGSVVEISQALAFAITLAASPPGAALKGASKSKGMPAAGLLNPASKPRSDRHQATKGQFQFTPQSWLHGVVQARGAARIGRYASRIFKTSSGRYYVPVRSERRALGAAMRNSTTAFVVAVNLARQNKAVMEQALARPAKAGDLFIAHRFGVQNAVRFIKAARRFSRKSGALLFPNLALANRNLFYSRGGSDGGGKARSIGATYASILRSFDYEARKISYATKIHYAPLVSMKLPRARRAGRAGRPKMARVVWDTKVLRAKSPGRKKPL